MTRLIRLGSPKVVCGLGYFAGKASQMAAWAGVESIYVEDAAGVLTFSNVCAYTMFGLGFRAWDPSYTLVPSTTGSSTGATSIPAPSVATGYGVLVRDDGDAALIGEPLPTNLRNDPNAIANHKPLRLLSG